jgi:hypothetical protein
VYSQHEIPWRLRALNAIRRFFGRPERRYLTDFEWKRYMDSINPCAFPGCHATDADQCRHWPRE